MAASPANLDAVQGKVRLQAMMGDIRGAKRTIAEALTHVDSTAIAIRFAYYQEMMWLLVQPLLRKIVAAKPADFFKDTGMGSLKIGRTLLLLGDSSAGQAWGDALHYVVPMLSAFPEDGQLTETVGRAHASPDTAPRQSPTRNGPWRFVKRRSTPRPGRITGSKWREFSFRPARMIARSICSSRS